MTTTNHIDQVRTALLDTLKDLRDSKNPMDVDRARAVAQVAGVLVDTAKVEVEYLKVTQQDRSVFLACGNDTPQLPQPTATPSAHNPFPVSKRHRLEG